MKMILQLIVFFILMSVPNYSWCALKFDGTDYIDFNTAPAVGSGTYTISVWFYRQGTGVEANSGSGGTTAEPLVAKLLGEADNSNIDGNFFFGWDQADNKLVTDFEDSNNGLNHPGKAATALSNNTWYNGVVSYNPPNHRFYLNGSPDGTTNIGTDRIPRSDSIQRLGIGRSLATVSGGTTSGIFNGLITEVAIWNVELSAAEIDLIYRSRLKGLPRQIQASKLKFYAPLDEFGDGVTATGSAKIIDRSGNVVNGTPTSTPIGTAETFLSYP